MSGIDWTLCIICQKDTAEDLRSPTINPLDVYNAFVKKFQEFKRLDSLPVEMELEEDGSALMNHQAKWHKRCHQKFNNAKLERAKGKRQREESADNPDQEACRPKRRPSERNKNMCIFCDVGGSETLHEFSTFNANRSINQMATDMDDMDMLVKISGGDLVALEAKYHFNCLSHYRNRYRAHMRSLESTSKLNSFEKRAKARAFAELIAHIDTALEEGNYAFKLAELHGMYENRLQQFGACISVHKTRLKDEIISHFLDYGIQEQLTGNRIVLIFPEGKCTMFDCVQLST